MKLNNTSMNKLFDLMLMSFKLQIVLTKFPEELYQITLNHFSQLSEILNKYNVDEEIKMKVLNSRKYIEDIYSKVPPFQYILIKQTLLRFFQGKNVKVTVFISEGVQTETGAIVIPIEGYAPPSVNKPHSIRFILKQIY